MTYTGECHCGALAVAFDTALPPAELPLRACACSFCRRHGACTTSDPGGHVDIVIRRPADVLRYRFGLRITEFLVCARCGVYVAAVMTEGDGVWAVVNVRTFAAPDAFARRPEVVSYEGETEAARRVRRRARWTPATVTVLADAR